MRTARLVPVLLLALALAPVRAQGPSDPIEEVGAVRHPPVAELSGIVRSPTYEGVWWVHNDSGDRPRLFAIDGKGRVLMPPWLEDRYWVGEPEEGKEEWPGLELLLAANGDWEDVATIGDRIYVADVGNNGNARRDLGLYVVSEPNPRATERMRPLAFVPVRYPDQERFPARKWHFDCEAVFASEGRLYLVTKHRVAGKIDQGELGAKLYRLDTMVPGRENPLVLVEERGDLALPTGADVSPDGTRLALLTARALWVFPKPAKGDRWLSGKARRLLLPRERTKQAEAVCWDDDETIRLANEQREIYRVKLAKIPEVE